MKKFRLISAFILFFMGMTAFAAGNHDSIDKFLKSYEEIIVAVEKAAKSNSLTDLIELEKKALELSEEAEKLEENEEWTLDDAKKFAELSNRYAVAVSTITNSTMQSIDMSGYGL